MQRDYLRLNLNIARNEARETAAIKPPKSQSRYLVNNSRKTAPIVRLGATNDATRGIYRL
ncbi:hypothetical protein thsrh120_36580 [Rhizobium sp. No.120]